MYEYFKRRCISPQTLDYADVRQDEDGNIVWNYYDSNDVLTMVKYRPSRKVHKGENKCWCQKNADTSNLLFNMNRINVTAPLLICEGEPDCLSAIESASPTLFPSRSAAETSTGSKSAGTGLNSLTALSCVRTTMKPGKKMQKEVVYRLGSWRTKVAEVPPIYEAENGKKYSVNDLNEALYYLGKEKVLEIILNAKDSPVPGVIDFSDIQDVDLDQIDGITTGIRPLTDI